MSYDLFFKSRSADSKPDAKAFAAFFKKRSNYEVTEQQALYQNEATGVYFIFDIGDVDDEEQPDLLPAAFKLFRSCEDLVMASWNEVAALVNQFPLEQGALSYRLLRYSAAPEPVVALVKSLTPTTEKPEGVSVDTILNAELVEAARKK